MTLTAKAKAAYEKYQKVKKAKGRYDTAKGYYNSVKNVLDEDTRSEEYFKLGLKGLMKLGEKAVGQSLTKHPYYAFHKAHLDVLGKALTASSTHENAMKALHQAIASADSANVITKQMADLKSRKRALMLQYSMFMAGGLQLLRNYSTNPTQVAKQIQTETGGSPEDLRRIMDGFVYTWRARNCELYFDGVDLFAMVDIEYKAASAAYKKYQQKVQKLQQGSSPLDRIAGFGAERKRQYEWLERVQNQTSGRSGGGSPQAVEDPSAYAGRQRDSVADVVEALAAICDFAMSPEAYNPNLVNARIGSL
jgi:tetratricopeptide (TPR) repeat protein